jgi:hypothetical protein
LIEEHGAFGQHAELIECREPRGAIGDVFGALAEHDDLARVGHDGGRDQIDQHFGHRLIDTGQRDDLSLVDVECLDPERPQSSVILADAPESNEDLT